MKIIAGKTAKYSKAIYRGLKCNISKKLSFLMWYKRRDEIKNWFLLYCCFSSLLIDFLSVIFEDKEWFRKLKIKTQYRNGRSFYFPLVKSRYYSMLTTFALDLYLKDFKGCYSRGMCFQEEDVVIDVGACVGGFCVPLFMKYPYLRVFSFEPDPYNISCLRSTLKSNRLDEGRFKAQALAVYGKPGKFMFSTGGISSRGSIVDTEFFLGNKKSKQVCVEALTLKEIFDLNQIKRCKLLKIDCEGSEYSVFENMPDEVLSKIENIFIEVHPIKDRKPDFLKDFLIKKGFEVRGEVNSKGCFELFCIRKDKLQERAVKGEDKAGCIA